MGMAGQYLSTQRKGSGVWGDNTTENIFPCLLTPIANRSETEGQAAEQDDVLNWI